MTSHSRFSGAIRQSQSHIDGPQSGIGNDYYPPDIPPDLQINDERTGSETYSHHHNHDPNAPTHDYDERMPSQGKSMYNSETAKYPCWAEHVPISTTDIREIFVKLRNVFGFQASSMENIYDHFMSQLESRSSRLNPLAALTSLHASYIGGDNSNYKKWFFAAQLDLDEDIGFNTMKLQGKGNRRNKKRAKKNKIDLDAQREKAKENEEKFAQSQKRVDFTPDQLERGFDYGIADYKWRQKMYELSHVEKIEQIALYLLIWGEANQIRFVPECLCFIYKCAWDHYAALSTQGEGHKLNPLPEFVFLNDIITPLYTFLRDQMYKVGKDGKLKRREKDHKDIIGYDDVNQLFWYPEGIERLRVRSTNERLVDIDLKERYSKLADVNWSKAFYKTFLERRTWLHVVTNFNRIWIIHLCSFWYFTSFNSPSIYTKDYNQLIDNQPTPQVRFTVMAFGGTLACLIQLLATFSEWSFVPREWPGAQHLTKRMLALTFCLLVNFLPSVYIFWYYDFETHSKVAYIVAIIQLIISFITTFVFAVVPLGSLFGKYLSKKSRRYASSRSFTASFPKLVGRSRWFSLFLWISIFTLKFAESYFFLTLSIRDPIRNLSIMRMTRCVGDHYLGPILCREQARITLCLIYFTDMALFFLDTYLWYIVCNCLFSVGLSFSLGISILSPWRNVYSRLPKRIYSKLLATSEMEIKYKPKILVSQVWNAIIISMYREHLLPIDMVHKLLYQQVPSDVDDRITLKSPSFFIAHDDSTYKKSEFFPPNSEAQRRVSFFAQSLSTPIPEPVAVESMPTFTVLIPHYGEKIILSLKEIIREANRNTRVTLLEYLKQLYPTEWECFVKDTKLLAAASGIVSDNNLKSNATKMLKIKPDEMIKRDTDNGAFKFHLAQAKDGEPSKNDSSKTEGHNDPPPGQMENGTTRTTDKEDIKDEKKSINLNDSDEGMLTPHFEENPTFPVSGEDNIKQGRINDLPFYCVGFKTSSPEYILRTRIWASLRTQTLYRTASGFVNYVRAIKLLYRIENPGIVQTYYTDPATLERELEKMAHRKFKLLIAMQRLQKFSHDEREDTEFLLRAYPETNISYLEEESNKDDPNGERVYYSCLIDGFCPLDENGKRIPKYKIRLSGNPILGDGKSDNQNHSLIFYRGEYIQVVDANQDNYLEECIKIRAVLSEFDEIDLDATPPYVPGLVYNNQSAPVAIVGTREYIFSENVGVLGDVAAGKEQTFGTLFARTLAEIGGKLHYGHPDFLNGIFMVTRGGISKAQKGLHLNEDIYAGMNAMLRGGRIKHCDYYQCGKGRDLGFGSILNFTTKIGAGMGEQILSREYYYLGTQLPIDRFLSFYYAHPGFHINNLFITLSVQMFMLVLVNIGALAHESTICDYNKDIPFTDLQKPIGCYNLQPILNWVTIFVFSVFIVFFISFVPLIVQELTERGFWKAFSRFFHHIFSLSPLFEVFVCQIYAQALVTDVTFGGARYISTGRGFAVSRVQFFYLYSKFAGSSIYSGSKLFLMLLFATVSIWQPALLWFWLTLVSMCLAPFIFNPHQFSFFDYFLDYRDFIHWLSRGNSKFHINSWVNNVKQSRARYTGYKKSTLGHESEKFSPETRKSRLPDTYFTELVVPFMSSSLLFFAYTFINAQNGVANVNPTNSVLRLLILVLSPIVLNTIVLCLCFVVSIVSGPFFMMCCTKKNASILAAVAHLFTVVMHLVMFDVIWYLEGWNFARTLICILCIISFQDFIFKFVTIVLLSREMKNDKINRSWWSGNWFNKAVGWRFITQPFRELIVKIMEMSLFAADCILGHCLLFVQTPFVFIPFIDRWHSMILFWMKPSNQLQSRILGRHQRHKRNILVAKYFTLYFLTLAFFLTFVCVPVFTRNFIPDFSNELAGTPLVGLIQPNNQDNDDTGTRAPATIVTTTGTRPQFKTVFF